MYIYIFHESFVEIYILEQTKKTTTSTATTINYSTNTSKQIVTYIYEGNSSV